MRAHRADLLQRQRQDHEPGDDGQEDDRHAPARADVVVEEGEDRVRDVDQRLQDVGVREDHAGDPRASVLKQRARLDRVVAAVAERVAARQAPGGEDRAAHDAELADRLRRVGRAGRLVLAAARQGGRDEALVEPDRGEDDRGSERFTCYAPPSRSARRAGLRDELARARPRPPAGPRARPARRRPAGRRARSRGAPAASSPSDQNASCSARFTAFLSTAPPTLRLTETPSRTPRRRPRLARGNA